MLQFLSALTGKLKIPDLNVFLVNLILAAAILIAGIILGKLVRFLIKKAIEGSEIEKEVRRSFIQLFLTSIKWAIYLLFFDLALIQLEVADFTGWITSILVVFPALVGALILIAIGFTIGAYLKGIIKESKIENWEILGNLLFYFVLYIFSIFALKTALISQDKSTVNIIIIILTGAAATSIAYKYARKK